VPTLFTVGQYDEVRPEAVRLYQSLVPGSRLTVIENAAHLTMQDEPERYLQVLREFLHEIERGYPERRFPVQSQVQGFDTV